jgi:(p)ppGpp synthase/HD superfamily hydrolase
VAVARQLAERAHATQRRKALNQPYISHLEAVAELLRAHGHEDAGSGSFYDRSSI